MQWYFEAGAAKVQFSDLAAGVPTGPIAPGFSAFVAGNGARAVLRALDTVTDVNVISSPQVLVLDNQTATLQVGDEVPVATQSAVDVNDGDTTVVNAIEFRDTGVILSVTPRVNAGGLVTMEVEQEVSDVVQTETSGIDSPTIKQRRIVSTVAVQSGQTVALGGLIRDSAGTVRAGVPLLKDIPLLGWLFSSNRVETGRTELVVLLTPRVVRNQQEATVVTDELRGRLRALQPLTGRIR